MAPGVGAFGLRMEAVLTTRGDPTHSDGGQDAAALAALVARASRGDERAWEELVALYARRVYALAQSRLRRPDLAEEITQSVFVTVAIKLKDQSYTEVGRFEPWLFRVAMNRVRDAARRLKRRPGHADPAALEGVGAARPDERDGEALDALRSAMQSLGEADREVIELRHHGQMGFKEIAALLGEPVGTVLARHHRALRKLRSVMEPDTERKDEPS